MEYLCSREGTVPVKDIAKRLFATPQTISSQLQDLREKGYVEANQRGRESLYEIREPLMRICVEVKDNQRIQPLRLLVDFLRVWYDDKELKRRLGEIAPFCEPAAYFASAIQRNSAEGNLRQKLILDDLQMSLPRAIGSAQVDLLLSDLKALPESAALAMQLWAEGKNDEAQQCFHELLAEETDPFRKDKLCCQVARALFLRGFAHYKAGDTQHAIEDFTAVIGLTDAPVELVAMTLRARGITFFQMGRKQEAESDFQAFVKDARSPLPWVVNTHLVLAVLYFSEGRWSAGLEAIEASLACGKTEQPAHRGNATDLVSAVFSAGLNPDGRRDKVAALLGVYDLHNALPVLGDAVVTHVGRIFRAGSPFPATDNLEGWALAWEEAAVGFPDFGLAMRLLRTGVDYVKAGGKEPGVLLSLSSTERAIVEQALGLSK